MKTPPSYFYRNVLDAYVICNQTSFVKGALYSATTVALRAFTCMLLTYKLVFLAVNNEAQRTKTLLTNLISFSGAR